MARAGEKMTLLDGKSIDMHTRTLVIADAQKPLALAGVMGGEGSGVTDNTKNIFLECAFFAPLAVAGRARDYGLHTDSSHRLSAAWIRPCKPKPWSAQRNCCSICVVARPDR